MWREALRLNPNLDIAYSGVGRSLLNQGQFAEAMRMYRLGSDRRGFSKALRLYRRDWVDENFALIFTLAVLLIVAVVVIRVMVIRRRSARPQEYRRQVFKRSDHWLKAYLEDLKYAFYVIVHPFDGFWDLKYEALQHCFSSDNTRVRVYNDILAYQYTGFIFNYNDIRRLNIYMELISVLLPFLLWCGVNLPNKPCRGQGLLQGHSLRPHMDSCLWC